MFSGGDASGTVGLSRRRTGALAALAVLCGIPAGYAIAGGSDEPLPDGVVAAEDCPEEVVAEFTSRGIHVDTFAAPCPSLEDAAKRAEQSNLDRRNGLTNILKGMRAHGAPEAVMAPVEAELEQLGGPYEHPPTE